MIAEIAIGGGDFMNEKIKTYNERLEIVVRKLVSKFVEPGEGYDELVFAVLEFIENGKRKK